MVQALQLRNLFLMCLFLMTSCGAPSPTTIAPATDEEFDAAVKQAHATLNVLVKHMFAAQPSNRFMGVKVRFYGNGDDFEDHWTEPVDYYDGVFIVRMLDGLTFDHGLNTEHQVEVPLKNILDWMVVENDGNLIGGFTIRLSYEHMTVEEKENFLKITGYKIQ